MNRAGPAVLQNKLGQGQVVALAYMIKHAPHCVNAGQTPAPCILYQHPPYGGIQPERAIIDRLSAHGSHHVPQRAHP